MPYFAVPENNIIVNAIIANTKEDADLATGVDCVEYTKLQPLNIGSVYNVEQGTWFPVIEQPAV
jgi:hypothetical protein